MKYVFLWTVQHSGTWLLVNVIDKCSIERVSFVQMNNLETAVTQAFRYQHKWRSGERVEEGLSKDHAVLLLQDHVTQDSARRLDRVRGNLIRRDCLSPDRAQLALAYTIPTIVTLRDPLHSVLTNRHRKPWIDSQRVMANWLTLTIALETINDRVLVVPIDLWDSKKTVKEVLGYLNLKRSNDTDRIEHGWPLVNSAYDYEEKRLYDRRDVKTLKQRLGQTWDTLCSCESRLRPTLERYGYRDLMWWA